MSGYKLPPVEHQFKSGHSGNPNGRPRGRRNTYTILDELLSQKILITQDGRQLKISKRDAVLLQAVNRAVKGDMKAIQNLFPHMLAIDEQNEQLNAVRDVLSPNDQAILENMKNRILNQQQKEEKKCLPAKN